MLSSLLRFGDRLSMAHGLEVRLPFCDHRIAEWAFGVSPDLLVGDGQAKRVLRLAIRGLVPDAIVDRAKQGFVPPQADWLTRQLLAFTGELLAGSDGIAGRLALDPIRRLLREPAQVRLREASALWGVTNLLLWERFAWRRMRAQRLEPASC
jgi:asparagine synthase (glutamine-hydrolysing)